METAPSASLGTSRLEGRLMVALLGTSVLLMVSTALSLWNIWQLTETNRAISHIHRLLDTLEELQGALTNAEWEAHAIASLGGGQSPEWFHSLTTRVQRTRISLQALSLENPSYQTRLSALESLLSRYLAFLEKQCFHQRYAGPEIAEFAVLGREMIANRQKIRRLIDEIKGEEEGLLRVHEAASIRSSQWAIRFNVFCGLSSVVVLVATSVGSFRHNNSRRKLETVLLRSHEELEKQILNRTSALRESEERIRAIVDTAAEGIITIDDKGVVSSLNQAASNIFGYAPQEIIGQNVEALLQSLDGDMAKLCSAHHRLDSEGNIMGIGWEVVGRRKNGSFFPMELSVAEIRLGGRRHYAGFVRDITFAKQAQEQLRRSACETAQKNKELEMIICAISHDLRSPLINIQGFSSELARISRKTEEAMACANPERMPAVFKETFTAEIPRALWHIQAGAGRMEVLLNGIIRFSRLGRAELNLQPLDMQALMANVTQALKFQLDQAQAKMQIEPLPGCIGDAMQISQVFCNLLDNSLKYSDRQRPLQIGVGGREEGDFSIYCVSDNGMGIAAEHLGEVFEMFHRVSPNGAPGDGLGLAIVRRIVERHHGRVWVESTPGAGSRFFLSLPRTGTQAGQPAI